MARYCPYCVSKLEEGMSSCPYCSYATNYHRKDYQLRPGTVLNGKYLIGRVLGEGGFGITYLGRDLTLDLKVAVKEYYPNGMVGRSTAQTTQISLINWSYSSAFGSGKEQFIQEARTIAKMDKEKAVVTVRDFFEENNTTYLVMEYVEGKTLYAAMQERGKAFSEKELFPLLEPVFAALGELHELGLIHRDISPDNLMLENGQARLIDFGCARNTFRAAESGDSVLKHGFSPIEQYENRDMGPWTDIYAMAATIYYCLTGSLVPLATERAVQDSLKPPRELGAKISAKQEQALMKALSVDPKARYQTIREFGKALFVRRNYHRGIAIGAAVVAAAAVLFLALFQPGQRIEDMKVYREPTAANLSDDALSADEKKLIEQMGNMLSRCSIEPSPTQNGYKQILVENTTDYDLGDIEIYLKLFKEDGTVCGSRWISINDFEKGKRAQPSFWGNNMKPDRVETKVQFEYNNRKLETPYYELPTEGFEKETTAVTVKLTDELPITIHFGNGSSASEYRFTSMDYTANGTQDGYYYLQVYLGGTYVSGPKTSSTIDYRLTAEDGTVAAGASVYMPTMKAGEKFGHVKIYVSDLLPGNYTLELIEHTY